MVIKQKRAAARFFDSLSLGRGGSRSETERGYNGRQGGALSGAKRHLSRKPGEKNTFVSAVHIRFCPFGRIIRSYTKESDVIGSAGLAAARSPLGSNSPKGLLFTPSRPLRYVPLCSHYAVAYGDGKPVDRRQGFPNTNAVSVGGSAQGRALLFVLFFRVKKSTPARFLSKTADKKVFSPLTTPI